MKIYIITSHEVLNCENQDVQVEVFTDKEKAQQCFEQKIDTATDIVVFNDWWIDETTETTFKAFEEGCECQNNINITLNEYEI